MTDLQKKQLEKVYAKIYEGTEATLTEEGGLICVQLEINSTDLLIRNFDYFKKLGENEPDEVVQIRYDHYKQRRYRKFRLTDSFADLNIYFPI
jgi:hypothetical protein